MDDSFFSKAYPLEDDEHQPDEYPLSESPSSARSVEVRAKDNYDSLGFEEAFKTAMMKQGQGGTFIWRGRSYVLDYARTTPTASLASRASAMSGFNVLQSNTHDAQKVRPNENDFSGKTVR